MNNDISYIFSFYDPKRVDSNIFKSQETFNDEKIKINFFGHAQKCLYGVIWEMTQWEFSKTPSHLLLEEPHFFSLYCGFCCLSF